MSRIKLKALVPDSEHIDSEGVKITKAADDPAGIVRVAIVCGADPALQVRYSGTKEAALAATELAVCGLQRMIEFLSKEGIAEPQVEP